MAELETSLSHDLDEQAIAATELKSAEDQLQSLCATHASTFVAVERRGAALTASLKNLLGALEGAIPQVEEAKSCLEFDAKDGKENSLSVLTEKHRVRRRTLLQHSSLLELLELPSLMDACVRGHLYEEGLSIASFANTLERRHLINEEVKNPIVENVVKDVRRREGDLRRDLLNRLRSDVTMPQCLEIVTALRRLNGVELERRSSNNSSNSSDLEKMHQNMEWRLQVNFLEARDIWLEGNATMPKNSGFTLSSKKRGGGAHGGNSEKLLDGIDMYRTRCFEIATQFLAIFRSSTTTTKSDNFALQILSMWTTRRIQTFLHEYLGKKCLPQITETSTLRDALESVTFFATSMGRVGADFSPLIQPYFESRLVSIVTTHWTDGISVFENTLKVCRDTGIASPLYSNRDVNALSDEQASSAYDLDNYDPLNKRKAPAPPRQLLSHPPLARLVNAFLTGLNELRRCLLSCAFPELRRFFQKDFLEKTKQLLVQNERAVLTPGFLQQKGEDASKLRNMAVELKEEFDSCVQPYLMGAIEVAFGSFDNIPQPTKEEEKEEEVNVDDALVQEGSKEDAENNGLELSQNDAINSGITEEQTDIDALPPSGEDPLESDVAEQFDSMNFED